MNEQQNRWDELAGELAGTDYAHAPESTQTAIDWIIKLEVKENRERASETSCKVRSHDRLLDALEAVEKLHYQAEDSEEILPISCVEGPCEHGDDCTEVTIKPCVECSTPGEMYYEWPCPTVKAIREALEIQP